MKSKNMLTSSIAIGLLTIGLLANPAHSEAATASTGLDVAMKSRTCGLILLSDGRASVRADSLDRGTEDLILAFSLLQDGRSLENKESARTASQKILNGSTGSKASAIADCKQWREMRKTKPDFQQSQADEWSWMNQALLTIQTE